MKYVYEMIPAISLDKQPLFADTMVTFSGIFQEKYND